MVNVCAGEGVAVGGGFRVPVAERHRANNWHRTRVRRAVVMRAIAGLAQAFALLAIVTASDGDGANVTHLTTNNKNAERVHREYERK